MTLNNEAERPHACTWHAGNIMLQNMLSAAGERTATWLDRAAPCNLLSSGHVGACEQEQPVAASIPVTTRDTQPLALSTPRAE